MKMIALMMLVVYVSLVSTASANYCAGVYWTKWSGTEGVCRANADGSQVEQIVRTTLNSWMGWLSIRSSISSILARATIFFVVTSTAPHWKR